MMVNSEHTTAFRHDLLRWYRSRARDLPWRTSRNPYEIWISEIMLQQTRVDQALPYFNRFLSAFPDIQSLASADIDEVLIRWEGLGYYARARNLHRAAKLIIETRDGRFPATLQAALELPGVGAYTAAAITSIAFNVPAAAVDGNVLRVLSRVFGIEEDVKSTPVRHLIQRLAQDLLDPTHPGDSNQSVMELGATVCTPRKPDCQACPLQGTCVAHRHNMTALIPVTEPRKPTPHHDIAVGVVRDSNGRILLVQRPHDRLLGGLWEYPGARLKAGDSLKDACRRGIREKLGLEVAPARELIVFNHQYSHFRITVHAFDCAILDASNGEMTGEAHCEMRGEVKQIGINADGPVSFRWLSIPELNDVAMHRSSRRISTLIANEQFESMTPADVH